MTTSKTAKVTLQDGIQIEVDVGTAVQEVVGNKLPDGSLVLGAVLNHRVVSLSTPIRGTSRLRPLTEKDRAGVAIYRRSISLVLIEAARTVAPDGKLHIGQSLGEGYFFEWQGPELTDGLLVEMEKEMQRLVQENRPFVEEWISTGDAIALFESEGAMERVRLLKTLRMATVPVISLGKAHSLIHGPVAPGTGGLTGFRLHRFNGGLILHFPDPTSTRTPEVPSTSRLFQVYRGTRRWNEIVGVANVGQFNELCINGNVGDVIKVAEALHERKVAEIAERALAKPGMKLILIAGPSSSGKTTFTKRLAIQLRVSGVRPTMLSLDNYYRNREETPRDEEGRLDFEALEALDIPLLNQHLEQLLKGERVNTPIFDFHTGKRKDPKCWEPQQLGTNDVLLMEGIHGLNERLTPAVPAEKKFRVYVSALTQLTVDEHERIFTADTRLLRRIVRDRIYRGYTAERTIEMWPSVRRGEQNHIFPFQELADAIFNSALVYEPSVLKTYSERYLLEVPTDSPSFVEADRLLRFLSLFVAVFPEEVPQTSILREFIGGSSFSY